MPEGITDFSLCDGVFKCWVLLVLKPRCNFSVVIQVSLQCSQTLLKHQCQLQEPKGFRVQHLPTSNEYNAVQHWLKICEAMILVTVVVFVCMLNTFGDARYAPGEARAPMHLPCQPDGLRS